MPRYSRLLRLFCVLSVLGAVCFFILTSRYTRAAAQGVNGRIAFTSNSTIYTMNPDGSGLLQLTPFGNGFQDRSPSWSPDGTKIVFSRATFIVQPQIYVMNADGTNPVRITNNAFSDRQPIWSPDGTRIAFVTSRDGADEIYVMNVDGSNQTRLTNNTAYDFDPAWSPDGTKIAFASTRDSASTPGNLFDYLELYVMDANGSNPIRLTNNTKGDAQPSWSPDGTKIAFTSQRDGLPLVYVMNANGTNQVNITQSTTLDSSDAEWSPDGTTIAFTSYNRVGQTNADEIYLMNADGSNIRRSTTTSFDEHDLAWQALGVVPPPTPTPTATPTPSPSPSYIIAGTATDTNGQPIADVTLVMLSDVNGTQITFTDASGNYILHFVGGVSHSLAISPSKDGYIFNPMTVIFISSDPLSGNRSFSFVGAPSIIPPPFQSPILLTQNDSLRAAALESVTLRREPFGVTNIDNFSTDQRGRVSLFATNIQLAQGEPITAITAEAEDPLGPIYPLTVEYYGAVPNFPWLKQVVVKLPDEIANAVEVRVRLKLRGTPGNKVTMRVKP